MAVCNKGRLGDVLGVSSGLGDPFRLHAFPGQAGLLEDSRAVQKQVDSFISSKP